jgi:hypothetical protein
MSTTPRTDEVYDRRFAPEKTGITGHELSKQLEIKLAAAKLEADGEARWALEYLARAERAEAEVERLNKRIKDDNRSYGCELRDPYGTIWEQAAKDGARAEKAEADTARLDWLDENMDYSGGGSGGTYTFFTPVDVECGMLRDAIDAAMKEGIK